MNYLRGYLTNQERKKYQDKIKQLNRENEKLKSALAKINGIAMRIINHETTNGFDQ